MHKTLKATHIWRLAGCLAATALVDTHAAQRVFTCRNWVDRDWPRTLLHYDINARPGEFTPGATVLRDARGRPLQHQVVALDTHPDGSLRQARVSFYAELGKDAQWTYTLCAADQPTAAFPERVTARRRGFFRRRMLEVTSNEVGVLLPPPGEHVFGRPADPARVPPPILGWRLADGQWVGGSRLESDRLVTKWSQRVVADGPLYKEYEYEVHFAPGKPPRDTAGYYRVRVRVEAEKPMVMIAEEYDFGCITAGNDVLVLNLSDGWRPDTAVWSAAPHVRPPSEPELARAPRIGETDTAVWREPLDVHSKQSPLCLFPHQDFGQHQEFGRQAQWYGLYNAADHTIHSFVGIMTMHTGSWRLPGESLSWIGPGHGGDVQVRLRISLNLSGVPRDMFNRAEIDPDLPRTLGRRMWALMLGAQPPEDDDGKFDPADLDNYRNYEGFITLDDYKDWILEWPEDKSVVRPRVVTTPGHLARLKANLERCPGRDAIRNDSLLTGDPDTALAEARQALRFLVSGHDRLNWHMTHYRQTQWAYNPAFLADSALAATELPDDLRRRLRANLAVYCHMWSHANFIPRGAGIHMGTPNMPINRFMGLPLFAALIPDHPRAGDWLDASYAYLKWSVASNLASGGGKFHETLPYTVYGPSIFFTTAAIALRNAGYPIDRFEPLKDLGRYLNAVDTPPTQVRGRHERHLVGLDGRKVRVLPALMHGSDVAGGQTRMMLANLTAASDPRYAADMMGAFDEAGGFLGTEMTHPFHWFYWDPGIAGTSPSRQEQIVAGLGGILRAGVGTAEESYLALRMGFSQPRGTDQGDLAYYAYGVNLVPPGDVSAGQGFGFYHPSGRHATPPQAGVWPASSVVYGDPPAAHEHARVDTNIEDYGLLPSLGYLMGRQRYKGRRNTIAAFAADFERRIEDIDLIWNRQFQLLEQDFVHSRQILMLRSPMSSAPGYIVMRDTTQGECPLPSTWHLMLTAHRDAVEPIPGGVRVAAGDGVNLDVTLVEPRSASPVVTAVIPRGGYREDYCQLSLRQGPGNGWMAVLYPYRDDEAPPRTIEQLGEGIIKVVTAESTDYVFCAVDEPVTYSNDIIDIEAHAGAIRVFQDKVVLVNASGRHGSVGYRGVTAHGIGPFEHATVPDPSASLTVDAGRSPASVARPDGPGTLFRINGTQAANPPEVTSQGLTGWILVNKDTVTYAMAEGAGRVGYHDFHVQGEAPFTLVHEPGRITLTTNGRRRIFHMPIPENIVPPHLLPPEPTLPYDYRLGRDIGGFRNWPWSVLCTVNGEKRMLGWYDGLMTIGVNEGRQEAVISRFTNPPVWNQNAWTRMLP